MTKREYIVFKECLNIVLHVPVNNTECIVVILNNDLTIKHKQPNEQTNKYDLKQSFHNLFQYLLFITYLSF